MTVLAVSFASIPYPTERKFLKIGTQNYIAIEIGKRREEGKQKEKTIIKIVCKIIKKFLFRKYFLRGKMFEQKTKICEAEKCMHTATHEHNGKYYCRWCVVKVKRQSDKIKKQVINNQQGLL